MVNAVGHFNHLVFRMLRNPDINITMIKNDTPATEVSESCRGICLNGSVKAVAHETRPIFDAQWHPKVSCSNDKKRVHKNFNPLTPERA